MLLAAWVASHGDALTPGQTYTSISLPSQGTSCSTYTTGKSILTVCNKETADVVYLHAQNYFRRTLYWNPIPGRDLPWRHGGFNFSFCSLSTTPFSLLPHQCAAVSCTRLYPLANTPFSDSHGR